MKKTIKIFLGLVLLLGATSVFASGPFNGQSGDCPSMGVGVYPNNIQRDSWGCWTATSITADAGDTVNVSMWYHNNTASTLTNVRAALSQSSTGPATHYTFSGNMYSNQGNTSLGSVSVNLSSSQTLTYQSAHWMKDKQAIDNDIDTALVNMQNGNQANLGSVPPGWNDYGQIIIVFKVGNNNNNNNNNRYCSISDFTVDGSSSTNIDEGDSARLEWDTNDCDSVHISNVGNVNDSGSKYVYPNYDTTYTLTAYDSNGSSQTRTVRVYVDENNNNNNDNCSISSFYASPSTINSGQAVTLTWNTYNCNYVNISNVGSNLPTSYSRVIYPAYSTTYTLNAYGYNGGSDSDSVRVNVNAYTPPTYYYTPPVNNTCAVTTVATNVGNNSVTLNGFINNSSHGSANSYFQYGTNVDMNYTTSPKSINAGSYINETITGLASNTIYYFRLVSDCNGGTARGDVDIFQTLGANYTKTVVYQGTTVVGTSSPIMLKIEDRYKSVRVGDIIDYTVTYKNIGSKKLTNSLLQVILPRGISYLNSSDGTFSNDTRTLTVSLGDLDAGEDGVIYLQGHVDSLSRDNAQIVTTALLVYTSSKGAQENAMAYVLNNPNYNGKSSLGASAFFGGFFGMSLIGWLLLIVIILLIILLVRRYYYPDNNTNVHISHH